MSESTQRMDAAFLQIEGRFARGPEGSLRLGFAGTVVRFRFRGRSLGLRLKASSSDVFFDIRLRGEAPARLRAMAGESRLSLLEGQTSSMIDVEIHRRSESWQGTCELIALEAAEGAVFEAPAELPSLKLMFVGDSITCGESTDRRGGDLFDESVASGAHRANAAFSFGKVLGQRLGAQVHLVSYGGRGVMRDWQGIRDTVNAPEFYERSFPDDASALWNPNDYVPHAVVFCLGTNDFSRGIPDQSEFVTTFVEFIRKVRRDFPKACILIVDSPIVEDEKGKAPKGSVLKAYLDEVADRFAPSTSTSPSIYRVGVSHCKGVPGDGHPTRAEQEVMADEIEPVLRDALAGLAK